MDFFYLLDWFVIHVFVCVNICCNSFEVLDVFISAENAFFCII